MTAVPERFSDRERFFRLRLARSENVGPITFFRLLDRFGTAERAFAALPEMAKRGGKPLTPFPDGDAEKELAAAEKHGACLVFKGEKDYPAYLAELEDAPPVITVMGNAGLLARPGLGVVGARNASITGRRIAEDFSRKVGQAGYVVASGLARGIDTAAHRATLETGTVAVVAGGIDVVYPPENGELYRLICEKGAIVAESPFGTEPLARHFPRRNRIISGLCLGVLVVEAAAKSGSLITARMALEQNRELFAVPGSPLDPRSEGANSLLREGCAHIATSADDILQVLRSLRLQPLRENAGPRWQGADHETGQEAMPDRSIYEKIIEVMSTTPVHVDEIIRTLGSPPGEVLTVILELELAGRIERHPGNKVNLI